MSAIVSRFQFRKSGFQVAGQFPQLADAFLRKSRRGGDPCVDVEHRVGAVPHVEPLQAPAVHILGHSFKEEQRGPDL